VPWPTRLLPRHRATVVIGRSCDGRGLGRRPPEPNKFTELFGSCLFREVDHHAVGEFEAAEIKCIGGAVLAELRAREVDRATGSHKSRAS
jgi:hypothetical protein